ncbi:actin [Colletotrichum nymphaeae SA-01]|uniref:Actin n=1 Tax=Colletotrichum nymphaeae SA-01 TaxID=1460502 RepID=A0A135S2F9_9PEZI|nr:actin [Colletotrichum nymphaeae SA-01]
MSPAFAARNAARFAVQRRQFTLLHNMRNVARSFEPHPFQRMSQTGVHAKPYYGAMIKKRAVTAAMFFPLAFGILGWPYASMLLVDGHIDPERPTNNTIFFVETSDASHKMTDSLHNAPIVLDNGSGTIRAGFAGDDLPKCYFPSFVGRPKHLRVLAGALEGEVFIGQKAATELRGLLKIRYPLEHGIVTDWDDMEKIWEYVYGEGLKTLSEEHPVLLTEPPLNPRSNRDTAAQILFETFNVPALYTSIQAVLSLYASGRTTGIVLDSGDGVSHAVPVYEGFAMPSSIRRIDVAGRDVTEYMQMLLRKSGYVFHTSAEKEVVRLIKESVTYVAHDPRKEEKEWANRTDPAKGVEYVLPDGHKLKIGAERFRAPEILFDPEIIGLEYPGVHQIVVDAINRTDLDLRKSLYSNIVLSGGSTLTRGFGDRLLTELQRLAVKDMRIKIFAPPERKYSTWIGGSILAGLSTFRKMWVSIDDWHENPEIIHTKLT